jgi:hypothetical protein
MNSLVNIIILWLLIGVNCQTEIFNVTGRYGHTATLIDQKLYILGGSSDNEFNNTGRHFFYLDVSISFNTQGLSWQNLSNINTVPLHYFAAAAKGGSNNDTLFLYGVKDGYLIYMFNPQSNIWGIPLTSTSNTYLNSRQSSTNIIDYGGKMYLWGGVEEKILYQKEMYIFDTVNLNWKIGNLVGAPTTRINCGAVFLPNNKIIYMGKQIFLINVILSLIFTILSINYCLGGNNLTNIFPLNEVNYYFKLYIVLQILNCYLYIGLFI